jgi:hypothetical protein
MPLQPGDETGSRSTAVEANAPGCPAARFVFERGDSQGRRSLWVREIEGHGQGIRLTPPNEAESSGDVSPDGRYLAYDAEVGGAWEVFIRRLDGTGAAIRSPARGHAASLASRRRRRATVPRATGRGFPRVDPGVKE